MTASSDYTSPIYSALTDDSLPGYYIKKNQQEELSEEMSILDYGKAAATGLYHGIALTAPESYVRFLNVIGRMTGSESLQGWARAKLDEYTLLREQDPFWRPDEKWMNSYTAKSLYEGFNSISNSVAIMLPGLAASPILGGTSLGTLLMSSAFGAGGIAGFAEFDSFLDEAYQQLSPLYPYLTREDIEQEHFWNAVWSGLAEGGFEVAGDFAAAKLIGIFAKTGAKQAGSAAVTALTEQEAKEKTRHIITKLLRNSGRTMFAEVPSEMATAAVQDWLRENSGLDHDGRLKAMINAFGPAVVSGGAFGVAGTAAKEVRSALLPQDSRALADSAAQKLISAQWMDRYGEAGFQFMEKNLSGLDEKTRTAVMELAQNQAQQWAQANGKDINQWWTDKSSQFQNLSEGGWSDLSSLAQAFMTNESGFGSVVDNAAQSLINTLDPNSKDALARRYAVADDGTGATLDSSRLQQDFVQWLQDPASVEVDSQTAEAFSSMRDGLLDGYGALKESGAVQISPEAQEMFDGMLQREGRKPVEAPKMFEVTDTDALSKELSEIAKNTPEDNDKLVDAFVRHTKYNMSPFTVQSDVKAIFAAFDKALAPHMKDMLAKQSDAAMDAKAKAEMRANGYTEAGINSLFGDVVDNAEGSLSFRMRKAQLYQTMMLKNMMEQVRTHQTDPSIQNTLALLTTREIYKDIHAQMRGVRSEAGRFLRAIQYAGKDNRLDMQRINDIVESSGGMEFVQKLSRLLQNQGTDAQFKATVEGTLGAKTVSMLVEHATLSMLTNPATLLVNLAGDGAMLFQETFNRFVGSTLNPNQADGLVRGETMAMVGGFFQGWRNIKKTWGDHKADYNGSRFEAAKNIDKMGWPASGSTIIDDGGTMNRAINYDNASQVIGAALPGADSSVTGLSQAHAAATHGLSTVAEIYGRGLGIVSKILLATDQCFKTLAYHMEMQALAHRRATQEAAATGGNFDALFKKYTENPLREDMSAAMDFAKKCTFQSDLGRVGKKVNELRQVAPLTRLAIPFLKTPLNIITYGAAHTPGISYLFDTVRSELRSTDTATRQLAEARVMTGTMVWAGALWMASQGMLTGGGPSDPEERKRLRATGWQPNSLRLDMGDKVHYIGLDRLDPGAFIFNAAASFTEIAQHLEGEDAEQASLAAIAAAIQTVADRSYLQSVQTILDMVMNLDQPEGKRAARDLVANLIPASALMRTTARVIDPIARETDGIFNKLRSNIPGFSMDVPERRNFLGEVMAAPDAVGSRHLSPIPYSQDTKDPVYAEVARLGRSGHSVPGTPQRVWKVGDGTARLDAKLYSKYLELSGTQYAINGKTLKQYLSGLVGSQLYQRASDEQKANLISTAVSSYRKGARQQMIRTDPGVRYLLGL